MDLDKLKKQISQLRKNKSLFELTQSQQYVGSMYFDLVFSNFDEALETLEVELELMKIFKLSLEDIICFCGMANSFYTCQNDDNIQPHPESVKDCVTPLILLHKKDNIDIQEIDNVLSLYLRYYNYKFECNIFVCYLEDFRSKFTVIKQQVYKKDREVEQRRLRKK